MSNTCLINDLIPEVKINGVTLSTAGSPELIFRPESGTYSLANPEQVSTQISIETSIQERITQSNTSWYRQSNILNFLRYRVLICLGEKNPSNLDFITQRFNEYHDLSGSFENAAGETIALTPDEYFLPSVMAQLGRTRATLNGQEYVLPRGYQLTNVPNQGIAYRPYQTTYPELYTHHDRAIGDLSGFETYSDRREPISQITDEMEDVILYDKPLSDILPRGSDGEIISRNLRETIPPAADRPETTILFEEVPLPDFSFIIGPDSNISYRSNEIEHLSLYAFVYLDYNAFLAQFDFPPDDVTRRVTLVTGVGKNNSATLIGNKFVFDPNTPTEYSKPKIPTDVIEAPDVLLLRDLRRESFPQISFVQGDFYNTVYKSFDGSLLEKDPVGKIIHKDNYFTDFWSSKDVEGNVNYMYGFSLAKFLAHNSQFPKLYSNPQTANLLINEGVVLYTPAGLVKEDENYGSRIVYKSEIKDMRVGKRFVDPEAYSNSNDLGTNTKTKTLGPSDNYQENYIPDPVRTRGLSLRREQPYETYFYQGKDSFDRIYQGKSYIESAKKYQYFSEVFITDSSKALLIKAIKELETAADNLYRLFGFISDPINGFYDPVTQRFTSPLNDIGFGLEDNAYDYARRQVQVYTRYLNLFQIDVGIEDIEGTLMSMLNSGFPMMFRETEKAIEKFSSDIAAAAEVFYTTQLGSQKEGYTEKTRQNLKNLHEQGFPIITHRNYFSNIVSRGPKKDLGYEYMSGLRDEFGLKTVSKGLFLDRIQREIRKYFYLPTTNDPSYLEAYPNIRNTSEIYDFFPYVTTAYSHFTPAQIYSQENFKNRTRLLRENIEPTGVPKPLTQTQEDFQDLQYFKFDINEYASVLANLIKSNKKSEYLDLVSFVNEDELENDTPNKQVYNSLLNSLGDGLSCEIELQTFNQNPSYSPASFENEDSSQTEEDLGRGVANFRGAPNPESIVGGLGDGSSQVQAYLDGISQTYFQTETIDTTDQENKGAVIKGGEKEPLLPIKFVFGVLGELELDPSIDQVAYQENMFNSIPKICQVLGISQGSLLTDLMNQYSELPYQVKALIIMSLKSSETILGPLATKRFYSDDHDRATEDTNTIYHFDTRATVQQINPPFTPLYDPMKIYAKFLSFWLNFKQINKVQVLSGFSNTIADVDPGADLVLNQNSLGLPIWEDLTKEVFDNFEENGELLLCRVTSVGYDKFSSQSSAPETSDNISGNTSDAGAGNILTRDKDLALKQYFKNIDLLDLPIYNKYFFIRATK